jgi:hypothetical protein
MKYVGYCFAIFIFTATTICEAAIVSTFDADLEGWTWDSIFATVQHRSSGGNPGGYFRMEDIAPSAPFTAIAPNKFLGNQSGLNNGTLSMDLRLLIVPDEFDFESFGTVKFTGSGGLMAQHDLVSGRPATSWITYEAPLTAATWGVSEADWATLLSEVTQIDISLAAGAGLSASGFDNFSVAPVPLPPAWILMLSAIFPVLLHGTAQRKDRVRG